MKVTQISHEELERVQSA